MAPNLAPMAYAQTVQVELTPQAKQELIDEIKLQIQQLLVQLIGILQQQLQDALAAQGQQINQLQSTVNTINTNTTPVVIPSGNPNLQPIPESLSIKFLIGGVTLDSPVTTSWPFINFYVESTNGQCPRNMQFTTDDPEGFSVPSGDNQVDYVFPIGYLGCNNPNFARQISTHTPGSYSITVTDLDTIISGTGDFTVIPQQ